MSATSMSHTHGIPSNRQPVNSQLSMWWLTIDRWLLSALIGLALFGVLVIAAASPAVAERIGLASTHFLKRHLILLLPTMAMEAGKEAVLETVNTIKERMRVKQAMMAKRVEEKKSQLKSIIGERFGDRLRGFRGGGTLSGSGGGRDANTTGARTTPPPKAKPKANQKKEE